MPLGLRLSLTTFKAENFVPNNPIRVKCHTIQRKRKTNNNKKTVSLVFLFIENNNERFTVLTSNALLESASTQFAKLPNVSVFEVIFRLKEWKMAANE